MKKPHEMTIGEMLEVIGWSARQLSAELECNERTPRRWDDPNDPAECPENVRSWLEALTTVHLAMPVPIGWRRRARHQADQAESSDPEG